MIKPVIVHQTSMYIVFRIQWTLLATPEYFSPA